jgi:NAD-dependent deacetylase
MDEKPRAAQAIAERLGDKGLLVVLTGAGISAESGIPTFRGPGGFWTVGSEAYRPEEMATFGMFTRHPEAVWQWYLYRFGLCRHAEPNPGHRAVREMEEALTDRFLLITQNVDGLHLRAGNTEARTFQIHGNIGKVRCSRECTHDVRPMPAAVREKAKEAPLTEDDRAALHCPGCGAWQRPHVLWFDESYNEHHYRFESSIQAAIAADVLITVGTSGATNLPTQVGTIAAQKGALLVDVNPEANPFSDLATRAGGHFLKGPSGTVLPEIAKALT